MFLDFGEYIAVHYDERTKAIGLCLVANSRPYKAIESKLDSARNAKIVVGALTKITHAVGVTTGHKHLLEALNDAVGEFGLAINRPMIDLRDLAGRNIEEEMPADTNAYDTMAPPEDLLIYTLKNLCIRYAKEIVVDPTTPKDRAVAVTRVLRGMQKLFRSIMRARKTKRRKTTTDIAPRLNLVDSVHNCTACEISQCATNIVMGVGPINSAIMIVGEAPGEQEDEHGTPFYPSAPCGKFLGKQFQAAGMKRQDVYITNAVKCRPPESMNPVSGTRPPSKAEADRCRSYLVAEIWNQMPDVIVALGKVATRELLDLQEDFKVGPMRKKPYWFNLPGRISVPVLVEYHPSFILRKKSPEFSGGFTDTLRLAHTLQLRAASLALPGK